MSGHEDVDVSIDRRRFAGVWANASSAIAHADEVTIDFIRIDPRAPKEWSWPESRARPASCGV